MTLSKFKDTLFMRMLKKKSVNYFILASTFFLVIFFSMITSLAPEKYELQLGQGAPEDLKAPRDLENKMATKVLIEKAVASVEPREKVDTMIQIDITKKIEKFFEYAYQIREMQETSDEEKLRLLSGKNELNLEEDELILMLVASDKELKNIESYIDEIITQVMSTGIKAEELDKEREDIKKYFEGLEEFSKKVKLLGIKIVNTSIQANRFLDVETTQQKIDEAINAVEKVIVKRGSIIVNKGDIITTEQMELLKEAGMTKEEGKEDVILYIGIGILVFAVEALLIMYMYAFNKEIFMSLEKLYLVFIIFLAVYLVGNITYEISYYIAPVVVAAMLIGILIDSRLAIAINLGMAIFLTLSNGNNIGFFITVLVGGTAGAFSVVHTHQRSSIFLSGLIVSLSNLLIILGLSMINHYELSKVVTDSLYGILNGGFCAILTIGSLPLWESAFHILTPLKLLELSNPNHPVLKKLLMEAPGTYHHSIIVGNLSEAAADAIGANGLLARVSAYYHDIGKLKRPYLFKENQLTSENPHDKITASLSAMIITSHVKDGLEIAKKYKLPKEISGVIEQHHGNTLVKYFYHKAMNEEGKEKEKVDEDDYRYKGQRPQTKEAAIVMLADSIEAAVRSMQGPNSEKIKSLIDKIIEDKLNDHQLDECDITLKDLDKIASTFITVLMGIFHERIEYPELNKE